MYYQYKKNQVRITKIKGEVSEKKQGVCFYFLSDYFVKNADELIYEFIPDRDVLSGNEIKRFFKFVNDIFGQEIVKMVGNPNNKSLKVSLKRTPEVEIAFTTETKAKLIFTFVRYLDEFPEIVKRFINGITDDLDKDFDSFLDLQVSVKGDKSFNLSGHGFSKGYYAKTNRTLAEFRECFKSANIQGCSHHVFKS